MIFDPSTISVESIRDATQYIGTRIRLQARLANVRQTVQIDYGVGDAVHPQPQMIEYPVLLAGRPSDSMLTPWKPPSRRNFMPWWISICRIAA